ncbi:threonine ammonia-lyase [Candidatus Halocynthiibacter alkanivorans]|uniref:threonine ammonia-lyase n=1 Tax=Candidatus Halocynthiibacter alkanivorans TaxID=2267619 RepID=UPI000DF385D6|nr:pyridoxal-phosphate dependent enzyme [Candidatus Halocynthiibacter alkanivorans]
MGAEVLTIDLIRAAQAQLAGKIVHTPVVEMAQAVFEDLLPEGARAVIKLELLQKAGSFKARGALLSLMALRAEARAVGVVAASGGNHALAVAHAAHSLGVSAKIAVPAAADPVRIEGCRALGAEVILCEDIAAAFAQMEMIRDSEGRAMVHPFEGIGMSLGAATCGAEYHDAVPDLDAVVLPVGGGGLISGMAAALKLLNPAVKIYGVEPEGADTMTRSLAAGYPVAIDKVATIADSLGAPSAMPFSFALAQRYVDEVVRVPDAALQQAMGYLNSGLKIMPEPACAASLAGAIGPLRARLEGKRIGLLACGSNISVAKFASLVKQAD